MSSCKKDPIQNPISKSDPELKGNSLKPNSFDHASIVDGNYFVTSTINHHFFDTTYTFVFSDTILSIARINDATIHVLGYEMGFEFLNPDSINLNFAWNSTQGNNFCRLEYFPAVDSISIAEVYPFGQFDVTVHEYHTKKISWNFSK